MKWIKKPSFACMKPCGCRTGAFSHSYGSFCLFSFPKAPFQKIPLAWYALWTIGLLWVTTCLVCVTPAANQSALFFAVLGLCPSPCLCSLSHISVGLRWSKVSSKIKPTHPLGGSGVLWAVYNVTSASSCSVTMYHIGISRSVERWAYMCVSLYL